MAEKTKLFQWNSDRGFGFCKVDGRRVFVHYSVVSPRPARGADLNGQEVMVEGVDWNAEKGPRATAAVVLGEERSEPPGVVRVYKTTSRGSIKFLPSEENPRAVTVEVPSAARMSKSAEFTFRPEFSRNYLVVMVGYNAQTSATVRGVVDGKVLWKYADHHGMTMGAVVEASEDRAMVAVNLPGHHGHGSGTLFLKVDFSSNTEQTVSLGTSEVKLLGEDVWNVVQETMAEQPGSTPEAADVQALIRVHKSTSQGSIGLTPSPENPRVVTVEVPSRAKASRQARCSFQTQAGESYLVMVQPRKGSFTPQQVLGGEKLWSYVDRHGNVRGAVYKATAEWLILLSEPCGGVTVFAAHLESGEAFRTAIGEEKATGSPEEILAAARDRLKRQIGRSIPLV